MANINLFDDLADKGNLPCQPEVNRLKRFGDPRDAMNSLNLTFPDHLIFLTPDIGHECFLRSKPSSLTSRSVRATNHENETELATL